MELYYVPYRKANIEWVLDINVKAQSIKLLEDNLHILDGANVTKSTRDKHIRAFTKIASFWRGLIALTYNSSNQGAKVEGETKTWGQQEPHIETQSQKDQIRLQV